MRGLYRRIHKMRTVTIKTTKTKKVAEITVPSCVTLKLDNREKSQFVRVVTSSLYIDEEAIRKDIRHYLENYIIPYHKEVLLKGTSMNVELTEEHDDVSVYSFYTIEEREYTVDDALHGIAIITSLLG